MVEQESCRNVDWKIKRYQCKHFKNELANLMMSVEMSIIRNSEKYDELNARKSNLLIEFPNIEIELENLKRNSKEKGKEALRQKIKEFTAMEKSVKDIMNQIDVLSNYIKRDEMEFGRLTKIAKTYI